MSKNIDRVTELIAQLEDISGELEDLLDEERDRRAIPHLRDANSRIQEAVRALEEVGPDYEGPVLRTGDVVIMHKIGR